MTWVKRTAKRAKLCKFEIHLVLKILWRKRITLSLFKNMKLMTFDTHWSLFPILSLYVVEAVSFQ